MRSAMRSPNPTDRPFTLVLALVTLLFAAATGAGAVILDDENVLSVTLDDGTVVRLYGEARRGGERSRSYHYLPANLRLARRPDGTPQLLFLKYTTEERAESGGVQGAILHLLVEWGLEPSQEAELREKLRRRHRGAELVGPVRMEATEETAAVEVLSATLADGGLTPTVLHSQRAPLLPGDRAAAPSCWRRPSKKGVRSPTSRSSSASATPPWRRPPAAPSRSTGTASPARSTP